MKTRAILLWSLYFEKSSLFLPMSSQTENPMPPIRTSIQAVMHTRGSEANSVRDEYSPYLPLRSKPALQNEDIAKKTEFPMPDKIPIFGIKRMARSAAPTPSKKNVPKAIFRAIRTIPASCIPLTLSCKTLRSLRPIFLPVAIAARDMTVIKPSPPV